MGRETNVQPRRRLVERVRGGEDGLSRVCGLPLLLRPPRTHAMPPIGPSRPVAPTTTDGAARREEAFQERITIEGTSPRRTFNPPLSRPLPKSPCSPERHLHHAMRGALFPYPGTAPPRRHTAGAASLRLTGLGSVRPPAKLPLVSERLSDALWCSDDTMKRRSGLWKMRGEGR